MPALVHALVDPEPAASPLVARGTQPSPVVQVTRYVAPSFDEVYDGHVASVWRILRTLGVAPAQLEDAAQDVFVVVHRRLAEFEGRSTIGTWLFAIARRVASSYRRRVAPTCLDDIPEPTAVAIDSFEELARAQAAATVVAILEQMDEDKRIVFALVELEQLGVPEVARALGLNLNTTYSRLRLARRAFEAAVAARGGAR